MSHADATGKATYLKQVGSCKVAESELINMTSPVTYEL